MALHMGYNGTRSLLNIAQAGSLCTSRNLHLKHVCNLYIKSADASSSHKSLFKNSRAALQREHRWSYSCPICSRVQVRVSLKLCTLLMLSHKHSNLCDLKTEISALEGAQADELEEFCNSELQPPECT